ncbi:hypothetical protein [Oscillibacter sp.]|uniref:hypothetical protein n=1 Tax=Oscillibacter sp. TaxID=1945593 RepID=UPI002896F9AC|nr:hypothetical protein [Oscillibacter sp.]
MKKNFVLLLAFLLAMTVAGCAPQKSEPSSTPNNSSNTSDKNPFQTGDEMAGGVLGSIGHSPTTMNRDENGNKLPFVYEGGEISIPYKVSAAGKAKNVGFLVFVDGIAQPYKTETAPGYQTMHSMNLAEDDKEYPFSIIFEPVTGKMGDTLSLMIVSVYAPDFMPDMENSSSYGMYHDTLAGDYEITFEADAQSPNSTTLLKYKKLHNVKQSTEPVTQDYLDSLFIYSGMEDITLETLNKQVFAQQFFDGGGGLISNLKVNADGTLHVTFKIVGYPGSRYRHTFYINHQALSDGKNTSFETVLTKGNVSVIEADIDLSELEDFNTFYVVSTLCNVQELWEDGKFLNKTASVLLYKK